MSGSVRRRWAQPWLGTRVEIELLAESEAAAIAGLRRGFAAVSRIQRSMSVHDPESEVSRLQREAAEAPVEVGAELYELLCLAERLRVESGGAFDIAVAPELIRWGFLPRRHLVTRDSNRREIRLLPERRVSFSAPFAVDLGGIAKGFAVDRAIDAIMSRSEVHAALVNAGGDMRAAGAESWPIELRHPAHSGALLPLGALRDRALATSGTYATRRRHRGRLVTPLVDPRRRRALTAPLSVSVLAASAVVADALTKVLALEGSAAHPLLARWGATPLIFSAADPPAEDWLQRRENSRF